MKDVMFPTQAKVLIVLGFISAISMCSIGALYSATPLVLRIVDCLCIVFDVYAIIQVLRNKSLF